jgi:hypothetical protein
MDNFGRTSLAWASLGIESHRLDVRDHTPYKYDIPLDSYMKPCRILPIPYKPNDLPLEAKTSPLRA